LEVKNVVYYIAFKPVLNPILRYWFCFLLLLSNCQLLTAQKVMPTKSDTVYQKIDDFSKHKKFYKFFYNVLFKDVEVAVVKKKKKKLGKTAIQKSFDLFQNRIIRNINIETLDPFGYSTINSEDQPKHKIERFGNSTHIKTSHWAIRNLLLFKRNDKLDSLVVAESERLIRRQTYISSVIIQPISIKGTKDSIDIYIRVLDSWSIIPTGAISNSKANLELIDQNILGSGHQFELDYAKSFTNNSFGYGVIYNVPSFKNTYISSSVFTKTDLNNNTNRGLKIDRSFYSTFTRWAGGIYYDYKSYSERLDQSDPIAPIQNFKIKDYSLWAGHSVKIFPGESIFAKTTNLIMTLGVTNKTYLERPNLIIDPIQYFSSSNLVLGTIGISSQRFYKDTYLFRFGIEEDIPYGKVFSISGGTENRNNSNRAYLGTHSSYGAYLNFGYLSGTIDFGTFFNNGNTEQTTIKFSATYFTDLITIHKWKFRQFIKPVLVIGNNRFDNPKDRLTLTDFNGIPGFINSQVSGSRKFVTSFQTQSYNPKSFYGFSFSPYINFTAGFLGDEIYRIFDGKMYSQIGIGVLVYNKYLVFNTFQFSLSYYPSLPVVGSNILKTNTFQNYDILFNDFLIGQPGIIPFQ